MRRLALFAFVMGCDQRVSGPQLPAGSLLVSKQTMASINTSGGPTIGGLGTDTEIDPSDPPPPCCPSPGADDCNASYCSNDHCVFVSLGEDCGTNKCCFDQNGGSGVCTNPTNNTCGALACDQGLPHKCQGPERCVAECCDSSECHDPCKPTCGGGVCQPAPNGTICEGSNPCTGDYKECASGACTVEHARIVCADATACRAAETCDAVGKDCDPGAPSATGTLCGSDSCVAGPGVCDGQGTCETTAATVDCATTAPACQAGSCQSDGSCLNTPISGLCTLANKCKINSSCQSGDCVGEDKVCPAAEGPCRVATCDPESGTCGIADKEDGASCNTTDKCTERTCQKGECIGVAKCAATTDCTIGMCDPASGECTIATAADGLECTGDGCDGAQCIVGTCQCPGSDAELALRLKLKGGCKSSALPVSIFAAAFSLLLLLRRRQRQG